MWNFLNTDPRVFPAAVSTNTSISSNLIAGILTTRGQKNKRHFPNTNLLKRKNSIYALPAHYWFTEQLGLHFSPNTGLSDPGNPHHWAPFTTTRSAGHAGQIWWPCHCALPEPSIGRTSFFVFGGEELLNMQQVTKGSLWGKIFPDGESFSGNVHGKETYESLH